MDAPPSTIPLERELLASSDPGSRVLELACALGRTAFELEGMGFEVTAVDIDPDVIKRALAMKYERGSRVGFIVADGRNLPFPDGSFEICVMNGFLTMLTDLDSRERAMSEAKRVLVDDGRLYLADFLLTPGSDIYLERYKKHERITGEFGTFIVTKDGSTDGEELYRAHHHGIHEISKLLEGRFEVLSMEGRTFRTYHENEVNGIIILAKRS